MRDEISEGPLRAGVELPASRQLAEQRGVSRGVATDAYAELEAQGYLQVSPRRPPIVAEVPGTIQRPPSAAQTIEPTPRFDLTPTTPDVTLFPRRQWSTALAAAVQDADPAALDYGSPQGSLTLREMLADELGRTRGVICGPENIIIVQGTAQAVDLLLRLLRNRSASRSPSRIRCLTASTSRSTPTRSSSGGSQWTPAA